MEIIGGVNMKKIERFLIRIVIIQCILLLIVQGALTQESIARYLSKVVYYEGITKGIHTNSLETGK